MPPENVRKPDVFWHFQGVYVEIEHSVKWVKIKIFQKPAQ